MSEQQTKHLAACASRLVQFDADSGEAVNCGLPCDCENPARWVTVPVGEPTPPATPQPETPLADVPHEEVDELVATIYAERRALSPPPDVERLTRAIRASLLPLRAVRRRLLAERATHPTSAGRASAIDSLDQVINVFEALSATPGEPT